MARPLVLITGGSGMLGRALAQRLHDGHTLVCVDIEEPEGDAPYDDVRYMDLTSPMSTRLTLRQIREAHGPRVAAVAHLAPHHEVSGEEDPRSVEATLAGTRRLLKMLEDFRTDRFVFASTIRVHAPVRPGETIREDSPLDPCAPYPLAMLEVERLIAGHDPPIPHTLLRLAGVYTGFGRLPALADAIERIRNREVESFARGDGEVGQSMVHADDAVEAIALSVECRARLPEGPILIGEPEPPGRVELQDRIGQLLWREEWPRMRAPGPLSRAAAWLEKRLPFGSPGAPSRTSPADGHYALDVGRARAWLGWAPQRRLENELPGIIGALESYPVAWWHANGLLQPGLVSPESPRR